MTRPCGRSSEKIRATAREKRVEVFAHHRVGQKPVAGERARQVVADHVFLRVAGDRDVVVVDQHLDVQLLDRRQPRGLGVVAFHLRAVGAEQDDRLARVGHRDAVAERPHVTEPAGRKLDAGREQFLRMAGQRLLYSR